MTCRALPALALLAAAGALPGAHAAQGSQNAPQLAGLFVQGCLPFVGTPDRLRAWAKRQSLREVPDPARAAFLHGAPGLVFDASNAAGKFVLVSSDDGLCSTVTDRADTESVSTALEQDLQRAGMAFRLVIERDDKGNNNLHYREYLAARNGNGWRILAATVKQSEGGHAMLTAAPE